MRHALMAFCFAPAFGAGPVLAQTCPAAPDHGAQLQRLYEAAREAKTENDARAIAGEMWELWTDAPNEQAQAMLDRGMRKRQSYDFLGALADLSKLIDYCPDYAEGYNQRAFVNYLRQDFAPALVDLDRALALSPDHVAALSGRALTLLGLGRPDEARESLSRALELNPWLPERGLAAPGAPLAPKGQDI
ncbi:tetratricopeptide repeat protein [Arenibacterium sp. CAU 1754]